METLVIERTTPMEDLLSLMGVDRLFAVKQGQAALLTPVETAPDNIGNKRKTLKERLTDFYGEDYHKHSAQTEVVDWGKPVGAEVW